MTNEQKPADIGELVKRLRSCIFAEPAESQRLRLVADEAARALTALEARCAELEKERDRALAVEQAADSTYRHWRSRAEKAEAELATVRDRIEREPVVKTLEWMCPPLSETLMSASTVVGRYTTWTHHEADGHWFWRLSGDVKISGEGASETEVQAAAQTDYERRILSALASAPERVEAEPVAWANMRPDGVMVGLSEVKVDGWLNHTPLYTSLPAPVVTDEMVKAARTQMPSFIAANDETLRRALEAALASREAT